jgi:hypothetical protein
MGRGGNVMTFDFLDEKEKWLFALFLKRITFEGVLECTDLNNDKDQAHAMIDAIYKVQKELANEGFSPR